MSAPTAAQVYSSCMEAAGDLLENIKSHNRDGSFSPEQRSTAVRQNAQAVLSLIQSAVTIHAASKNVVGERGRRS
jgi:hypothetical protein